MSQDWGLGWTLCGCYCVPAPHCYPHSTLPSAFFLVNWVWEQKVHSRMSTLPPCRMLLGLLDKW